MGRALRFMIVSVAAAWTWATSATIRPIRRIQSTTMLGMIGWSSSRSASPYTSIAYFPSGSLPRYSLRLPTRWATTKPSIMMPLIAMTHFLPTADR
ncbi:MAG: hypothetical protein V9G12_04990 [Microthrixaceae bacterium]